MGPLDYSSPFANLPTAGASLMQGVQAGAAIQQAQVERQQKQLAAQQAQQQRDDLAALSQNPTPDAIASLMIKYPALSEQLKRGSDVLTSAQQQGRLDSASQVYAALQSGAPDIAAQLLKDQAAAARNSGNERDAQAADTFAKMVTEHPELAKTTIGLRLAAAVGPEKFAETFAKMGSEQRAQELQGDAVRKGKADADAAVSGAASAASKATTDAVTAQYAEPAAKAALTKAQAEASVAPELARLSVQRSRAEIGNIADQIATRAKNYMLDERRLSLEIAEKTGQLETTKLDPQAKKSLDDAVTNSAIQSQTATSLDKLAGRFEEAGGGFGAFSWALEKVKQGTGFQGEMTQMRQEYTRVRNSLAIKSLPPGPATDKDIELAMRGFPGENASSAEIAGFLRGMAKLSRLDAAVSSAKAEWISANGGLRAARRQAKIGGVEVAPGMKFEDIAKAIVANPAGDQAAQPSGTPGVPAGWTVTVKGD